eukprot:GHVH01015136.1.p1 GENE.GHVH01015136.1~~GHVH01015136.1.p1  ORF type:complete len:646 (-),score=85.52 GHVH01015136.1:498-2435(-)
MSNDGSHKYIPPYRRNKEGVDNGGGGRKPVNPELLDPFPARRCFQDNRSGRSPEAPQFPRRAGIIEVVPSQRESQSASRPERENNPTEIGGRGGKKQAVAEDGELIDTVKAWKSRGKIRDPNFDVEKAAELIFGPPGTKKGATGSGINFDSFFDIPVQLTGEGNDLITEIPSFQDAGAFIHPALMENIARIGYNKPTPVQKWSIPCVFAGRDLMACAQTGSGKTAAFLFPIISKMLNDGPPNIGQVRYQNRQQRPNALVLSPTRELATQIFDEAKKFCFNTGIRPVVVYGGQSIREQYNEIALGCDVCIATPGRLIDHVTRKNGSMSLSKCYYFVLDEADRMLDMGFSPQITEIVDNCHLPNREIRQTIMFSATFPLPIQRLAEDFMCDYLFLAVGRVGSTNECIKQIVLYADEKAKPSRLMGLLSEIEGLTLIFVETKKKADIIHEYLGTQDIGSVAIHGDRTQSEREEALETFRSGLVTVMVATDVVGRGLDIPNVTHVINHDMPPTIDDYVHRIGRTGRAGNQGRATTFITESNGAVLRDLITLLEEAKQDTPQWLLDMVSQGASFGRGRGTRGRGGGGARESRNDVSAYGMAIGARRGGLTADMRYMNQNQGMMGGGQVGQGAHQGFRTKKPQRDETYDGW